MNVGGGNVGRSQMMTYSVGETVVNGVSLLQCSCVTFSIRLLISLYTSSTHFLRAFGVTFL